MDTYETVMRAYENARYNGVHEILGVSSENYLNWILNIKRAKERAREDGD